MPILSKPNSVVPVQLPVDDLLPEDQRPTWQAIVFSDTDQTQYEEDLRAAQALNGNAKRDALNALILRAATGWDMVDETGAAKPFNADSLNEINRVRKLAIAAQLPSAAGWGSLEKKP